MKNWAHFLGGSITVYLLMAACSAGSRNSHWGDDGGKSTTGHGGASSQAAGGNATGGDAIANAGTSAPNGSSGDEGTTGASGGMIADMVGDMMDPVPAADAAPATSGSRLRARYYVGEDGARQFIGWHDTKRDEDCMFQTAEDGKLRCMPSVGAYALTYFADEACTSQPLMLVAKTTAACANSAPTTPAKLYVSEPCGANRSVYTVSRSPATTVYQKGTTTCAPLQPVLLESYDFMPLTAPIAAPASAFVAATEEVE